MERILLRLLVPLSALALASCGFGEPHVSVLQGNYASGQGRFQRATVEYLEALEAGQHTPWILYNLGNSYHSLGENEAALEMWNAALASQDPELMYRAGFNRGVLFYEQGRFQEAYSEFRYALVINSSSIAAKVNLELTVQKLQAGAAAEGGRPAATGEGGETTSGDPSAETLRVLNYIRRKEANRWRSQDQPSEDENYRDW